VIRQANVTLGVSSDLYGQTVGDSIPDDQTLSHSIDVQNRTGYEILLGYPPFGSPAAGFNLADGADFSARLRTPDRLHAIFTSYEGPNIPGVNVLIITD
jgi:hypothetical protein